METSEKTDFEEKLKGREEEREKLKEQREQEKKKDMVEEEDADVIQDKLKGRLPSNAYFLYLLIITQRFTSQFY